VLGAVIGVGLGWQAVTGRRAVMLDAALSYVDAGWPFVPGVTASGLGCSCGRSDCRSPAAHPREQKWQGSVITDPALVAQIMPGLDVQHRGAGEFVPAPPSTRGARGDDVWLIRPGGGQLMPCEPVVATLVQVAATEQYRPRGHRRTAAWS
jgi:hypothetical protein